MQKVLITGASGFAGSFLVKELLGKDYQITGTYLTDESLEHLFLKDKIELKKIDLNNEKAVEELVNSVRPDLFFHLAASSSAAQSFENPREILVNNMASQVNILEALKNAEISCRIIVVSSAEVYGAVESKLLPINESTPLNPMNAYAVSKLTQDFLGLQYSLAFGMDVIRIRPFNHIGPRQSPRFVISSFAKQIAEIEKDKKEPILKVGNLSAKRDFSDVRDIARAYILLCEKGVKGDVYNIGSGKSYTIQEMLDKLLSLTTRKISIEQDRALFRPVDSKDLICDYTKMKDLTGWTPEISIETSLKDTLEYWRNIV